MRLAHREKVPVPPDWRHIRMYRVSPGTRPAAASEVLGMVAGFYKNREIPITIPIFIAITALSRLIILQGKEINALNLIYESVAVLLLAIAAVILRWNLIKMQRSSKPGDDDT